MFRKILVYCIVFTIGVIVTHLIYSPMIQQYESDNIFLINQLHYYESEVMKMEENGWTQDEIREYATKSCISLLELKYNK